MSQASQGAAAAGSEGLFEPAGQGAGQIVVEALISPAGIGIRRKWNERWAR